VIEQQRRNLRLQNKAQTPCLSCCGFVVQHDIQQIYCKSTIKQVEFEPYTSCRNGAAKFKPPTP